MTRAAIYVRISRDMTGDGLGVMRQEADCRDLCDRMGWEIVRVYVDNDVSATSRRPRPSYLRMLNDIRAGEIRAIAAWHPDRLYRRTTDLEELVEIVEATRVPIATVNAGTVDLTTPSGRLVARLLGATARYEGEHKAERWQRGWEQRRRSGLPPLSGPRMFGWTRGGEIIPTEAALIRKAADDLLEGRTLYAIAQEWNAAGSETTRGNKWTQASLRQLLRNWRLAGWVTMGGYKIVRATGWPAILSDIQVALIRTKTERLPE